MCWPSLYWLNYFGGTKEPLLEVLLTYSHDWFLGEQMALICVRPPPKHSGCVLRAAEELGSTGRPPGRLCNVNVSTESTVHESLHLDERSFTTMWKGSCRPRIEGTHRFQFNRQGVGTCFKFAIVSCLF